MQFSFRSVGFPARLAALLKAQKWEQGPFAEHVIKTTGHPFGQSRVSTLKNGKADPTLEEVEALAASLGVTAAWLAFEDGKAPAKLYPSPRSMPPERMQQVSPKRR